MPVITLADIKRRCVLGTRLTMTFHRFPHLWRNPEARRRIEAGALTRPVVRTQTNGVYLGAISPDGIVSETYTANSSFLDWPRAAQFRATGPDSFEILADPETDRDAPAHSVIMAYRIEPAAPEGV